MSLQVCFGFIRLVYWGPLGQYMVMLEIRIDIL